MKNRPDAASRTLRANKTCFVQPRTRLGADFGCLGTFRIAPGRPSRRPGTLLGTLRALPGRAGDLPRCSRDASWTLLGCSWAPRGVPGRSRERFWLGLGFPGSSLGTTFGSISVSIFAAIFDWIYRHCLPARRLAIAPGRVALARSGCQRRQAKNYRWSQRLTYRHGLPRTASRTTWHRCGCLESFMPRI